MNLELQGKVALITGGTKGIGAGTAEVLAQEGCNLILNFRSDEEGSIRFAKELADKYHIDRDKLKALVHGYDNQETFGRVLNALGMSMEELRCYTPREEAKISTVIKLDNLTENQYELIFKILDLANIAYTEERPNECNG